MSYKIMLTAQFSNNEFASPEREQGLDHLRTLGTLIDEPAVLGAEHTRQPVRPRVRLEEVTPTVGERCDPGFVDRSAATRGRRNDDGRFARRRKSI